MATTKATNLGHRSDVTLKGTTTTIETDVVVSDTTTINNAGSDVGLKINSTSTGHIMQLQDNGTDVMVVADGGKVGIGTDSPDAQIDVIGTTGYRAKFAYDADRRIEVSHSSIVQTSGATQNNSLSIVSRGFESGAGNSIIFKTGGTSAGTGDVERMRIDSSGRATMPYQPLFDVSTTSTDPNTGDMKYGYIHINVGSYYNSSTGRFTAPVSGYYEFSATAIKSNGSSNVARLYLKKNNSRSMQSRHFRLDDTQTYGDNGFMFWTLYLNANEYVNVECGAGTIHNSSQEYSHFRGRLLG